MTLVDPGSERKAKQARNMSTVCVIGGGARSLRRRRRLSLELPRRRGVRPRRRRALPGECILAFDLEPRALGGRGGLRESHGAAAGELGFLMEDWWVWSSTDLVAWTQDKWRCSVPVH